MDTPHGQSDGPPVTGFIHKLQQMIDDDSLVHRPDDAPGTPGRRASAAKGERLISWDADGTAVLIRHADEFARRALPRYFKHANLSSFVRQLNMYGFHKVSGAGAGDTWEFAHPLFRRARPDLYGQIRRRAANAADEEPAAQPPGAVARELAALRAQQSALQADIAAMRRDAQFLWEEARASRERHAAQQAKVDRILYFLASVFAAPGERAVTDGGKSILETLLSSAGSASAPQTGKRPFVPPTLPLIAGPSEPFIADPVRPAKRPSPLILGDDMPPLFDEPHTHERGAQFAHSLQDISGTASDVQADIDALFRTLGDSPLPEDGSLDRHDPLDPLEPHDAIV